MRSTLLAESEVSNTDQHKTSLECKGAEFLLYDRAISNSKRSLLL